MVEMFLEYTSLGLVVSVVAFKQHFLIGYSCKFEIMRVSSYRIAMEYECTRKLIFKILSLDNLASSIPADFFLLEHGNILYLFYWWNKLIKSRDINWDQT